MMMGLYVMKDVPFHDVYLHALVRDEPTPCRRTA